MDKQFKEIGRVDFPKIQEDILAWWEQKDIFAKSISTREDGIPFTFYEGPPTANGKPGIHHVMARTVKDLFCRYKTLKGYRVLRKGGWDTHGLPVEIEVEKELGLESREDVEEYGIAAYNKKCREQVLKYKALWDNLTRRMAYWVDLDDPYITFENRYIESVWWAFKKLFDSGLVYKGYKIQWYSPGSGTVLSSHEVSLGYEEVQDPSIYVKFPVDGAENTCFLAWTTTPWTIISNMALAVNPDLPYVKIKIAETNEYFILAQDCVENTIEEEYTVVDEFSGKSLLNKTYQPVFDYALQKYNLSEAWHVIPGDYVTTEEGTGVVHTAPAFGADDYESCREAGIPLFNPIAEDGTFTKAVPDFAGQWFKDTDKGISRAIKEKNLMYKHETVEHNYPFDWRKGTPLMSYPVESWFIETTKVKEKMIAHNHEINWKPESTGTGRFGTWLENNVDWAVSRQRFWGTPIPLWVSDEDPGYVECIGSIDELREKSGLSSDATIDLHRPQIDELTWKGPDGATMRRIPDLLDVWFDSGSMPFAQWHYPFEKQGKFEENFPADFIAEGVDQTRGWFYTLHALATMLFDQPAYKNVISNGLVLDANGNKMSKSKGNTVDPFEIISKYGADTVRWYMMSNAAPWENIKFGERGLQETQRKFFNTIVNVYSFFALYANIDEFAYNSSPLLVDKRPEMDRWIISRLNTLVKKVDEYLESYDSVHAARRIEDFVQELSNWYVRRSRRRFWKKGKTKNKLAAYQTLYECLVTLAQLMSPIAPFLSEWLYQRLNAAERQGEESVHLSFYPTVEETTIDRALEHRMQLAQQISSMTLSLRNKSEINVRQPLERIIIPVDNEQEREAITSVKDIILDEVNIKKIEFVRDDSGIVKKSAKPNFPILGKRLGSKMKDVVPKIKNLSDKRLTQYEEEGTIELDLGKQGSIQLSGDDLKIIRSGLQGWQVETEQGLSIALDTSLTDELVQEGLAREFVNRIQNMRKEADFNVTDRIQIGVEASDKMARAIASMDEYIKQETLAKKIVGTPLETSAYTKTWKIDGQECTIFLQKNLN
jgi:isoleucyl-tRNA synthetase